MGRFGCMMGRFGQCNGPFWTIFLEIKIFGAVLAMGRFGIDPNMLFLRVTSIQRLYSRPCQSHKQAEPGSLHGGPKRYTIMFDCLLLLNPPLICMLFSTD